LGVVLAAIVITLGIVFSASIPSWNGAGAAWNSFLPWSAVLLVVLGAVAAVRRAWWGVSAVLVAVMVWSGVFVPQLLSSNDVVGAPELTVATQNIGAANSDPAAAARVLAATGAGLVAVQEIVGTGGATGVLDSQFADHVQVSTVGLWSKWAMDEPTPLELGLSWARAFRVVVHHDEGDIAVYAVHLPSVRPGDIAARDQALAELTELVAADPAARVLVMGDLNTATTDPALDSLTSQLADSREAVKGGFGFTWPAQFPLTRPDHVLSKGMTPVFDTVLAADGSDHRAILAGLSLQS
jgi:vancomycin resistance protein VanJ